MCVYFFSLSLSFYCCFFKFLRGYESPLGNTILSFLMHFFPDEFALMFASETVGGRSARK